VTPKLRESGGGEGELFGGEGGVIGEVVVVVVVVVVVEVVGVREKERDLRRKQRKGLLEFWAENDFILTDILTCILFFTFIYSLSSSLQFY
jgi:hypothetical protein